MTEAGGVEAAAKGAKERKKRAPKATPATAGNSDKSAATSARKPRAAKRVTEAPAMAPASAADEMAELLRLEEENQRLRQTLAQKLRAENADLRKRLDLA